MLKQELKRMRWVDSNFGDLLKRITSEPYAQESHIANTVYFGNSEESRAIQLADVCCATITRQLRGDLVSLTYYQALRGQIVNEGARPEFENAEQIIKRMNFPWLRGKNK